MAIGESRKGERMEDMYFFIDTIRGNAVYGRNAVKSKEDYTAEAFEALMRGEEVPVAWDQKGNPVEWEILNEEE